MKTGDENGPHVSAIFHSMNEHHEPRSTTLQSRNSGAVSHNNLKTGAHDGTHTYASTGQASADQV
jgi:hypothetical protein